MRFSHNVQRNEDVDPRADAFFGLGNAFTSQDGTERAEARRYRWGVTEKPG